MARIMAIDYGRKRIGLAITDETQFLITPLEQVKFNKKDSWELLFSLIQTNNPHQIIIGNPDLQNQNIIRQEILDFKLRLNKLFPKICFTFVDESYSSVEANNLLIELGSYGYKNRKKKKKKIDSIAAAVILQQFLHSKKIQI